MSVVPSTSGERVADATAAACAIALLGLGLWAWLPRGVGILVFEAHLARQDLGRAALLTADRAPVLLGVLAVLLALALGARVRALILPSAAVVATEAVAWAGVIALVAGTVLAVPSPPLGDDLLATEHVAAHVHAGMVLTLVLVAATLVFALRTAATAILLPRSRALGPVLRAAAPLAAALVACWPILSPWMAAP